MAKTKRSSRQPVLQSCSGIQDCAVRHPQNGAWGYSWAGSDLILVVVIIVVQEVVVAGIVITGGSLGPQRPQLDVLLGHGLHAGLCSAQIHHAQSGGARHLIRKCDLYKQFGDAHTGSAQGEVVAVDVKGSRSTNEGKRDCL